MNLSRSVAHLFPAKGYIFQLQRPQLRAGYSSKIANKLWCAMADEKKQSPVPVETDGIKEVAGLIQRLRKYDFPNKLSGYDLDEITISPFSKPDKVFNAYEPLEDIQSEIQESASPHRPLQIKIEPKGITIFIEKWDEELHYTGEYRKVLIRKDSDFKTAVGRKGDGLISVSDSDDILFRKNELVDGGYYRIFSQHLNAIIDKQQWNQVDDKAMEDEVGRAVLRDLKCAGFNRIEELDRKLVGVNTEGKTCDLQEWDYICKSDGILFLCECKHNMDVKQVQNIPKKIDTFQDLVSRDPKLEKYYMSDVFMIKGIAAGKVFTKEAQEEAKKKGLLASFPDGGSRGMMQGLSDLVDEIKESSRKVAVSSM